MNALRVSGIHVWYDKNANNTHHDVGTKKFNAWGIEPYGNVYDVCLDWQEAADSELVQSKIVKDYAGAVTGTDRVARGGDIWCDIRSASSVHRYYTAPDHNGGGIGFRLVRMAKSRILWPIPR